MARRSGILLHPTSLPGKYGIGTLGREAHEFVDFLADSRQKLWQVLPLGPTGYADSPYQSLSAFAGNPLLVAFDGLVRAGWLSSREIGPVPDLSSDKVDYARTMAFRSGVLRKAYAGFVERADSKVRKRFDSFCESHQFWLDDFALFMTLKSLAKEKPWVAWHPDLARRHKAAIRDCEEKHADDIRFHKFVQFVFFDQWLELKAYAASKSVEIIGDLPLYVAHDSADCWAAGRNFLIDHDGHPKLMAGVPPDFFSKTGQLWGNPVYNWRHLKETGFEWWVQRVRHSLLFADLLRLDHFRGLAAYWAVPYGRRTAARGKWHKAPGRELLEVLQQALGSLPLIAEDLGVITSDVVKLRDDFGLPGMKIMQYGFDSCEEQNGFLPHTYRRNCVVYTGTHDNDSVLGWYHAAKRESRTFAREYLGADARNTDIAWAFIRGAWGSVADMAIVPLQDILGLGGRSRMNYPGTTLGNWQWRVGKSDLSRALSRRLARLTAVYGR